MKLGALLHRRASPAPSGETVADVLGRWPAAPAGSCDICGDPITSVGTYRVSAKEFKGIMHQGYNPFDTGRAPKIYMLMGVSAHDAYADWRQMVERDSSDWGLCARCAGDVATFVTSR